MDVIFITFWVLKNKMLPTLQQTKELYDSIIKKTDILNLNMGYPKGLSSTHYQNVAFIAASIADHCSMDIEKAYILGLLHDYGEYIEKTIPFTFHGTAGYDEMMKLGFDEVARTCLSHSFFDSSFTPDDFPAYDKNQIKRASVLLKEQGFDDYDRLIHLSDMMAPFDRIDTIENRIEMIAKKYHLSAQLAQKKLQEALELKTYFNHLCGKDIYTFFDFLI